MLDAAPAVHHVGPPSSDDWVDERVIVRNTFIDICSKEDSDNEEGACRSPAHRRNLSAPPSPSKSRGCPDGLDQEDEDDETGDGWALVWAGDSSRTGAEVTPSRLPLWVKAARTISPSNSPKRLGAYGSPKRIPCSPKRISMELDSVEAKPPSLNGVFDGNSVAGSDDVRSADGAQEPSYSFGQQPSSGHVQVYNMDGLGACTLLTQRWNEYVDPSYAMRAGVGVCQEPYAPAPVLGTQPVPEYGGAPTSRGVPPPRADRKVIAGPPGVWKAVPR